MATKKPRVRRSADDAKRAILDAAERRLHQVGPDGLRLQEIADDVGVSHPAVLHHFGSREALVEAVVERAVTQLENDLVQAFAGAAGTDGEWPDPRKVLDMTFATLGDKGQARLMAWLTLSGQAKSTKQTRANWARIIDGTHALRLRTVPDASREDTAFIVTLSSLALFAEAFAGDVAFANAGLDKAARARFRPWLAALLVERLASPSPSS